MLAGLTVAGIEAALAIVALPTGLTGYLLAVAALTGILSVVCARLFRRRGDGDGDYGGGGTPRPPSDDPPEPPWWPAFEATFREYVRHREREGDRGSAR